MSAVVCGKRSHFEEIHPPIPKRLRCSGGSSPVRFPLLRSGSPARSSETGFSQYFLSSDPADQISHLKALFPDMDGQLIEKILESCGNDLDSAIKSLNELHLESTGRGSNSQASHGSSLEVKNPQEESSSNGGPPPSYDGSKWVDLFVQEMLSATNLDDAKARAAKALEAFEKTVMSHSGSLLEDVQKENALLKEQLQTLLRDNQILKRAVAIQHERQAEHDQCSQEMQQLKQLVSHYQEQVRTLEVNNYALTLHLRKAQEGTSMPGRFHPDVF